MTRTPPMAPARKRLRPILLGLGVVVGVAVGFGLFRKYGGRARDASSFAMFGETKTMVEHLTGADATSARSLSTCGRLRSTRKRRSTASHSSVVSRFWCPSDGGSPCQARRYSGESRTRPDRTSHFRPKHPSSSSTRSRCSAGSRWRMSQARRPAGKPRRSARRGRRQESIGSGDCPAARRSEPRHGRNCRHHRGEADRGPIARPATSSTLILFIAGDSRPVSGVDSRRRGATGAGPSVPADGAERPT